MRNFLISFFLLFAFADIAAGQPSAQLLAVIGIQNSGNMNFGNIAVSGSGTVIIQPLGSRSSTGGVTLPAISGTVSSASFLVTGDPGRAFSITLPPGNHILTRIGSLHTMVMNNFTSVPSTNGALAINGTQTIYIGATLNVNSGQLPGTYTNALGFAVTVNYN